MRNEFVHRLHKMPLYRIAWISATGQEGHGEYCLSYEIAQAWLDYLATEYPDIQHQLVPAL